MNQRTLIPLGLIALSILCLVCVTCHRGGIEGDLLGRTEAALANAGASHVTPSAQGRDLTLEGVVTDQTERQRALATARDVRGVRTVHDALTLGNAPTKPRSSSAQDSATLTANFVNEQVVLQGIIDSVESRRELVAKAAALFGEERVVDRLVVGSSSAQERLVPPSLVGLEQLALTSRGQITVEDGRFAVQGHVASERVARQLESNIRLALPQGWEFVRDLTYETAVDEATCQGLFTELLASESIEFETSSAAIRLASRPLLNRLADAAERCQEAQIQIGGHTDSRGSNELNQRLSERRAQSVVSYLAARGVTSNRLSAKGFGETQPIADNSTPSGRQANRRIEFRIQQKEG